MDTTGIRIDGLRFTLFGDSLRYDGYYFDLAAEEAGTDRRAVLKSVVQQWAAALENAVPGDRLYLPYSLDDEWVECFDARVEGQQVVVKCVYVAVNGYSVDPLDLATFITSVHKIDKEYPQNFGVYRRSELVSALHCAEINTAGA